MENQLTKYLIILVTIFLAVYLFFAVIGISVHSKLRHSFRKIAEKFVKKNIQKILTIESFKNVREKKIINYFTEFAINVNKEIVKFLPAKEKITKLKYIELFKGFSDSFIYPLQFTDKEEEAIKTDFVQFYLKEIDNKFEKILSSMNVE
ncbi:MAG: hypothetical protein NTZ97_00675 [Candidatus Moranbacteria bacterium]|nr:hypothetical protein [Candidatus Moranbacteria bacterium]